MPATGKTFNQLEHVTTVPHGSYYAVEMGDNTGTKAVEHSVLVDNIVNDLPPSWGGSSITVNTTDSGLFGQEITLSDGVDVMTSRFSSTGEAKFTGVSMVGQLVLSTMSFDTGRIAEITIAAPYYGTYVTQIDSRHSVCYIHVTTDDDELIGQVVTATNGTNVTSAIFTSSMQATLILNFSGVIEVTAQTSIKNYKETLTVPDDSTETYEVEFLYVDERAIFGVEWDGSSSSKWTRTDGAVRFPDPVAALDNGSGSSPFDNIPPWRDIKRVTDPDLGELVEIPKYYYKLTKDGAKMKLQISSTPQEGFLVSPAHSNVGAGRPERSKIYVGRYHCTYTSGFGGYPAGTVHSGTSSTQHPDNWKSLTQKYPYTNRPTNYYDRDGYGDSTSPVTWGTPTEMLRAIKNDDVYFFDFKTFWTIAFLYLVEYADWDVQSTIGMGTVTSLGKTGATDNMLYHTGTTASTRSGNGRVQYRYIEDLWSNVATPMVGIYINSYGAGTQPLLVARVEPNPDKYGLVYKGGGLDIEIPRYDTGYVAEWEVPDTPGYEFALLPSKQWMAPGNKNGAYDSPAYVGDYWGTLNTGATSMSQAVSGTSYGILCFGVAKTGIITTSGTPTPHPLLYGLFSLETIPNSSETGPSSGATIDTVFTQNGLTAPRLIWLPLDT